MGGGARGLAHDEARAGDARGGLPVVRHGGAAAGDQQVVDSLRHDHAVGKLVEAALAPGEAEIDVAGDVRLDRPAVDTDGVGEIDAVHDVVLAHHVFAAHAPRLADADLRRDLDDVRALEPGGDALDELEGLPALAAALDLAVGQLLGVDAAYRAAVGIADLGEVGAPLDRVGLRAHDGLLAREAPAAPLGFFHELGNAVPGLAGLVGVDAADAVHGGGKQHAAAAVAYLVGRAAPGGEVAVAGAVDEDCSGDCAPARLGFDQEVIVGGADGEGVEEELDPRLEQQLVGGDLVGRDVVGLRVDAAAHRSVRLGEPVHAPQPLEHVVADAVDHLPVLAVHVGVQAAEGRETGRRAGAAEKAVALDQRRGASCAAGGDGRGDAGRAAAQHHYLEPADDGRAARLFYNAVHEPDYEVRPGAGRARRAPRRQRSAALAAKARALRPLRHRVAGALVGPGARARVSRGEEYAGNLEENDLSRGLRRGAAHRPGAARPRPGRRKAARHPVRQQRRARPARARRDARGRAGGAGLAGVFADVEGFRQAEIHLRAGAPRPGVRGRADRKSVV